MQFIVTLKFHITFISKQFLCYSLIFIYSTDTNMFIVILPMLFERITYFLTDVLIKSQFSSPLSNSFYWIILIRQSYGRISDTSLKIATHQFESVFRISLAMYIQYKYDKRLGLKDAPFFLIKIKYQFKKIYIILLSENVTIDIIEPH